MDQGQGRGQYNRHLNRTIAWSKKELIIWPGGLFFAEPIWEIPNGQDQTHQARSDGQSENRICFIYIARGATR